MNLKNIVIGIAILILTITVVIQGINTFYDGPEYSDFCPSERVPYAYSDKGERICPAVCVEMYEIVNGSCSFNECGSGCGVDGITSFETEELCLLALDGKNCYGLYDDAQEDYSRNIFLIALPLGIAIIAAGAIIFGLEAVGAGLMGGGVGIIIWGVGGFWRFADDWLKFLLSLIGLIVVIWLAYYFNRKWGNKKRRKR
jgi:hypothetical protein